MGIFFTLLQKLIPLYFIILLGYLFGRFYEVNRETVAKVLIYVVAPIVIFNGVVKAPLSISTLSVPLIFFCVGGILCTIFYNLAKCIWAGHEKNIIGFTAATANTGYFGLPVAIFLFGDSIVPFAVLISLGTLLSENVFGLFVLGKGHYSSKDSIKHLLKLPNIYACFLGLIVNLLHWHLGTGYSILISNFQGAYIVLGMLIIGLGISDIRKVVFDFKFNSMAFAAKFLAWPLLVWMALTIITYFHPGFYSGSVYAVILLMSIVPLAANSVVYTMALKMHPERTALTVLLSTFWVLFYMPFMLQFIIR